MVEYTHTHTHTRATRWSNTQGEGGGGKGKHQTRQAGPLDGFSRPLALRRLFFICFLAKKPKGVTRFCLAVDSIRQATRRGWASLPALAGQFRKHGSVVFICLVALWEVLRAAAEYAGVDFLGGNGEGSIGRPVYG